MNLATVLGILGAGIILILFILNQNNKLKNDDLKYDFFNLVGSVLLIIHALMVNSIPFAILNIVWAVVSGKDVVQKYLKSKNIRLTV